MYEYKVARLIDVVDGDTIDVQIDLGFDVSFSSRVRLNGIDTPESRTLDLREKKMGLAAKEWLKHRLESAKKIVIKTEKPDSSEKYGRILGTIFIDGEPLSLNDQLVKGGYAWAYDGGTKHKDLDALEKIRLAQ
ncbi:nuclease [bacterium]|jgi:micrococcal nuclease|nr:nuclease [bacterium]NBT60580.1 nuclease [Planctomycetia bacterium]